MKDRTIHGPGGISLELDSDQIYPDDPGQGTPALVVLPSGQTGTYYCVTATGETVDGDRLADNQLAWLNQQADLVDGFIAEHTRRLRSEAVAENRSADHVDGYDRDDVGESPDC